MTFDLKIRPAILVEDRHAIENALKKLGYIVCGGGTHTDGSESDIIFYKTEDTRHLTDELCDPAKSFDHSDESKPELPTVVGMEKYIGTKTIKATAMSRGNYNAYQNWEIPANENPLDAGYLVGYSDADGNFNGSLVDGCYYISWSPADVFEAAYVKYQGSNYSVEPIAKTLHNSEVSGARKNVKDIRIVGNGDSFKLLFKASSENEGWMKSTKAMEVDHGCLVQVTTQQKNPDGSYVVAEALTFVPEVAIRSDMNDGRKLYTKK